MPQPCVQGGRQVLQYGPAREPGERAILPAAGLSRPMCCTAQHAAWITSTHSAPPAPLTWCIHCTRPGLLPERDVDLPQLLVQPLHLLLALPGSNTANESTHQSDQLGDAHDVDAKGRGTQLATLGGPGLLLQLLACPFQLTARLTLLLQAQLVQLALLLSQDAPVSAADRPSRQHMFPVCEDTATFKGWKSL